MGDRSSKQGKHHPSVLSIATPSVDSGRTAEPNSSTECRGQEDAKTRQHLTNNPLQRKSGEPASLLPKTSNSDVKGKAEKSSSSDAKDNDEISETAESDSQESTESEQGGQARVFFRLGRTMTRLYMCDDLSCPDCACNLEYIFEQSTKGSEIMAQRLLELGMLELFHEIWSQFFHRSVVEQDSESTPSNAVSSMEYSCKTVGNMADESTDVCRKLIRMGLHVDIIEFLKDDLLDPGQQREDLPSELCTLVDGLMTILYNVVQAIPEAREYLREQGIVELLQRFLTKTNDAILCQAMILLAWVLNEEDKSFMGSYKTLFEFLETELATAVGSVKHRSDEGYKVTEILEAVNKLAVNDENKIEIVKSGILSSYSKLLETTKDANEQVLAAQGIWSLALGCAEEIRRNKNCVESLQNVLNKTDQDAVRKQVIGALTALGLTPDLARISPMCESNGAESGATMPSVKLFISYQHASKDVVFQIRNRLRDNGYNVWIDADEISGSIGEDITVGIDQSTVVLSCLSQKYYESPFCRKEVIYSDDSKKELIPLVVEPKYKPHGWLSFRMADKLRIDFSQPQLFEDSFRALLRRISKFRGTDDVDCIEETITCKKESQTFAQRNESPVVQTATAAQSTSATRGIFSWTEGDVRDWLERNNLHHLMKWFEDYDGRLLLEFKSTLEKTPQLIAPSFIADHSVKDFLRLKIALQEL